MTPNYVEEVARDGFAIVPDLLDSEIISNMLEALVNANLENDQSQRAGKLFGIRNLLNVVPLTRDFANSPACRSLVEPILGTRARVVQGILGFIWTELMCPMTHYVYFRAHTSTAA
ncbi:MAG TPA: hypothetical protein VLB68_27420 [Pyrinomonadaceae bacterium]|nr:hypothetical protein [Pyrinomonadaceae bacterium]